jgi:fimbrial chaperone protein
MFRRLCLCALLTVAASEAAAANIQVAPLRIYLNDGKSLASIAVKNGGDEEIAVQAEILEWTQVDGVDDYRATRDVLVNPVIFKLDAKGTQIVRLGLQVPDSDAERSYRIFVQQLPAPASARPGGLRLQTLLRLGVPVFVPAKAPRVGIEWQLVKSQGGQMASLEATNTGNTHLQITRVVVRQPTGRALVDMPMSTYLLSRQKLVLPVAVPLDDVPVGAVLTIEQSTDAPVPLPSALLPLRADSVR